MFSPWIANVISPTRYRMQLAHQFSQEGRRVFGERWKGVYVIGSTASGLACHLKDVDVFPLVEGAEIGDKAGEKKKWREVSSFVKSAQRNTGVCIEVWLGRAEVLGNEILDYRTLRKLREKGLGRVIESEAVSVDFSPGLNLPERVEKTDFRKKYHDDPHAYLRGETREAKLARIRYEKEQRHRRHKLVEFLKKTMPDLSLGESEKWVAAFIIMTNFIPLRYSIYQRFEFLVSNEREIRDFLGCVPGESEMMTQLYDLAKKLRSSEGVFLKEKLIQLKTILETAGFKSVPDFLIDTTL